MECCYTGPILWIDSEKTAILLPKCILPFLHINSLSGHMVALTTEYFSVSFAAIMAMCLRFS